MNIRYPLYEGVYRILTNHGTDNYRNKCLSGLEETTKYAVRANDGLSKENSPCNTGQVTGCAGCVPGSQYFQKGTADLPG